MTQSNGWSRRGWLRTLGLGAGACALSPLSSHFVREARGSDTPPKRVVFVVSGNGWLGTGRHVPPDLADERGLLAGPSDVLRDEPFTQMPPVLASLEAYRSRTTIVSNLWHGVGAGHWHGYPALTLRSGGNEGVQAPRGASIDQIVADRPGADAPLRELSLAVSKLGSTMFERGLTAYGAGRPVTFRASVRDVHTSLFGGVDEASRRAAARTGIVLDGLAPELAAARARLAGQERLKLEHFESALEGLQRTQTRLLAAREAGACDASDALGFDLSLIEGRQEAMFAIATAALACGLTRSVTLSLCTLRSFDALYSGLGYEAGCHGLGHGGADPVHGYGADVIHAFQGGLLARMLDTLASIPEEGGSVLDHTLVVWLNENGPSHHSRPFDPWTVFLLGNASGALRPGGRYVQYPWRNGGEGGGSRRVGDLYRTIAEACDVPLDAMGSGDAASLEGPLSELLA